MRIDPIDESSHPLSNFRPKIGERILDVGRNRCKLPTIDEPGVFEIPQRLREHLFGDAGNP